MNARSLHDHLLFWKAMLSQTFCRKALLKTLCLSEDSLQHYLQAEDEPGCRMESDAPWYALRCNTQKLHCAALVLLVLRGNSSHDILWGLVFCLREFIG